MKLRSLLCAAALSFVPTSLASGQSSCWGDVTLDRRVNINDLLQVIINWGPCVGAPPSGPNGPGTDDIGPPGPPTPVFCAADIYPIGAPDGFININDLLLVITTWGECSTPIGGTAEGYVIWCEDWSTGNYSRWSSAYNADSNPCTVAGFNSQNVVSAPASMKSQVTCIGGTNGVHRGYGGFRFQGENILPTFAIPSTGGFQAPHGFVVQLRNYLSVPYLFNAQDHDLWMSMMTVTDDCSNAWHRVITLNIDDDSMRLRPQHVSAVQYAFAAPPFPRDQWNRITVYVNIGAGDMHVWQNGIKIAQAWFTRPNFTACQFHFGLYCSGANPNITYYEDDMRVVKLTRPLIDFIGEPTFPGLTGACAFNP